jgi:hypothetical protein
MGLGDAYLAEDLREIFGLVRETHAKVLEIGAQMATAAEQINALGVKIDDIAADFEALRDAMEAERENLSPSGQAALDAASQKLDALDTSVGDADGSDTPPEPEPVP